MVEGINKGRRCLNVTIKEVARKNKNYTMRCLKANCSGSTSIKYEQRVGNFLCVCPGLLSALGQTILSRKC